MGLAETDSEEKRHHDIAFLENDRLFFSIAVLSPLSKFFSHIDGSKTKTSVLNIPKAKFYVQTAAIVQGVPTRETSSTSNPLTTLVPLLRFYTDIYIKVSRSCG